MAPGMHPHGNPTTVRPNTGARFRTKRPIVQDKKAGLVPAMISKRIGFEIMRLNGTMYGA
jgi:hypothetical protein